MEPEPIDFLVFGLSAAAIIGLVMIVRRQPAAPSPDDSPRPLFGRLTPTLAALLPTTPSGLQRIRADLSLAGYYHASALMNFLAVRAVLTLFPVIAGQLTTLAIANNPEWWVPLVVGLVVGIVGFSLPRVVVSAQATARGDAFLRGLPVLMDTLSLSLSAGEGIPAALAESGNTLRRGYPELAEEMRLTARQGELRSLDHALDQLRQRVPLPEVANLAFLLSQGERLGTDVTPGLTDLSEGYRLTARQRAEARANRASIFLLFPTVGLLFVASMIVILGPLGLEVYKQADPLSRSLRQGREVLRPLQVGPPAPSPTASPSEVSRLP